MAAKQITPDELRAFLAKERADFPAQAKVFDELMGDALVPFTDLLNRAAEAGVFDRKPA